MRAERLASRALRRRSSCSAVITPAWCSVVITRALGAEEAEEEAAGAAEEEEEAAEAAEEEAEAEEEAAAAEEEAEAEEAEEEGASPVPRLSTRPSGLPGHRAAASWIATMVGSLATSPPSVSRIAPSCARGNMKGAALVAATLGGKVGQG